MPMIALIFGSAAPLIIGDYGVTILNQRSNSSSKDIRSVNSPITYHLAESARQAKIAAPMGKQALQETHSALSGPPEYHMLGRSGCRTKGLDRETKSVEPEINASSILLNDLYPPIEIIVACVFSLRALAPGRK